MTYKTRQAHSTCCHITYRDFIMTVFKNLLALSETTFLVICYIHGSDMDHTY